MNRVGAILRGYIRVTHPVIVAADVARLFLVLAAPMLAVAIFRSVALNQYFPAPVHRGLLAGAEHRSAGIVYGVVVIVGFASCGDALGRLLRNLVAITLARAGHGLARGAVEKTCLPPFPYHRESFTLVLGELQDRDGTRVPSARSPHLRPRWLTLPELALYTGVFVTGGIGSGKTSAVAYPALRQLLGFRRPVRIRASAGTMREEEWRFSGLVLDEKGDFTRTAAQFCEEWGRSNDLIRISPGGRWIWNPIYNPNLATWAVGYQLGWIIRTFNKGASASDPFWETAPRELVTDYLGLLNDADGYYTIFDYLETLIDDAKQDELLEKARQRHVDNPEKLRDIERYWKSIERRREGMGVNLRGSLEACAKAGIDMFRHPELRKTFCPSKEEYFETDSVSGMLRPRSNVFTGFDQVLDYGRIVGLEMSKYMFFDAAIFIQVALKSQWQDAVLRREQFGSDGRLIMPPRFGEAIGYCPTFLMADEAQVSATPRDGEFKAVCRSKRASIWELTQSHSSIKGTFGASKQIDASVFFQNSMTHIYLRQSDMDSMKLIQEECGKRMVAKTSFGVTEGGNASELSYAQGEIVHEGVGFSSTKTISTEEKPFVEIEDLKRLPNNAAVVLPSNGDRTLPATVTYLRPLWVFRKYPDLPITTSWLDWPAALRSAEDGATDQAQTAQAPTWKEFEPIDEAAVIPAEDRLGRFIQPAIAVVARPSEKSDQPEAGFPEPGESPEPNDDVVGPPPSVFANIEEDEQP